MTASHALPPLTSDVRPGTGGRRRPDRRGGWTGEDRIRSAQLGPADRNDGMIFAAAEAPMDFSPFALGRMEAFFSGTIPSRTCTCFTLVSFLPVLFSQRVFLKLVLLSVVSSLESFFFFCRGLDSACFVFEVMMRSVSPC